MQRSIKARLLGAFFLINAVFLISSVVLFVINNYTIARYTQVVGTMSSQYKLSQSVSELIDTYNELVLSNSTILSDNKQKIAPITNSIDAEILNLNLTVVDPQAKLSFAGLRSSIEQVLAEVASGLNDVAEDKPTAFAHYQAAHHYYDFVQANSTTFAFDQLRYINSIEAQLRSISTALQFSSIGLLVLLTAGSAWYAVRVARRLVNPLSRLTGVATAIAGDNMKVVIDQALLRRPDEIGVLSNSFNTMFQRLKGKIKELEIEKLAAERAQAKDEAVLSSIGDAMLVTDSKSNILLINQIAADLLGLQRGEAIGKLAYVAYEFLDESSGSPIPVEQQPLYTALHFGKKVVQTVKFLRPDKTKLALSVTVTPVIQQGQTVGGIQIIRNITKEKEVDRMKTEFISLASHQLRTPLSAIKWFTEMLLTGDAGKLTPEQQEFSRNVAESTERMIQLVNSLLNISRLESGRIIIDPRPTNLSDLVKGIVNDLKAKTLERQQTLLVSVHKELPEINLDPRLIGQVYLNLLTNAIKYTPKGGEISVLVSRKGDDILSQVTDNGYGIPKSEHAKMFQKFFRASNIVKVEADGTGLGMYLVKAIVESSGGKIWFESAEGKGTTFWFTIPLTGMEAKAGEVTLDI